MVADVCQVPIDSLVRTRLDPVLSGILRDDLRPGEIQSSFYFATNDLMRAQTRCGHHDSVLASRLGQIATVAEQTFTARAVATGYSPADLQRLGIRDRLVRQKEDTFGDYLWVKDQPRMATWDPDDIEKGMFLAGAAGLAAIIAGVIGFTIPSVGALAAGICLGLGVVVFFAALFAGPPIAEIFRSAVTDAKTQELQVSPDIVIDPRGAGTETFGKALDRLKDDEYLAKKPAPDAILSASVSDPRFLRWGYIDQHKVWPHRASNDIFHFRGGAVVKGSLECVEEVVYHAGDYSRFLPRVKQSRWIGATPPKAIGDKSGMAMGVVAGRYGFTDRVTALRMTEKVLEAGRRLRISFDSVDGTAKKSLNESRLTAGDQRDRVSADNQGEWDLTRYAGPPQSPGGSSGGGRVLVRYKSSLDIKTWIPDPVVGSAIPADTKEAFNDILKEIARRCGSSR